MTKETLTQWGLTAEQADRVMEGLNGSFVTKARFNEVNTELQTARAALRERDGQLETLNKSTADAEELKSEIAHLQAENRQKDEAHAAELRTVRLNNAVELALNGAKARNHIAVRALLADFLTSAEVSDDGSVAGLSDAIKRLTEGEDTAFLFEAEVPPAKIKGAKGAEKGDHEVGGVTLQTLKAMSPADRYAYAVKHPDEYKQLYGGNV